MLDLPVALYRRESLVAAARALGERAAARIARAGARWKVTVSPTEREGDFLNEALSHEYRQRVLRARGTLSAAVLGRAIERGFAAVAEDPLEMLEPRVREERAAELAGLLAAARELER